MKLSFAPSFPLAPVVAPIAALAAAALAAPAAHAQSSVTLYGIIDTAIQVARTGGNTVVREASSSVAPNRWGLFGKEDLGGGYSAVFKLENGFNLNSGAMASSTALFNREAWIGIRGPFGQIQAGNNYTPLFLTYVTYSIGELNALAWGNATNNYVFVPAARTANSIRYTSNELAGFTLRALYARGANGTSGVPASLGDTLSAGVNFKAGQFSAAVDYLQQRFANTATLTTTTSVGTGRYYLIGVSYDFGFVKTAALYQMHRNATRVSTSISSAYATPNHDFYEVNALIRHLGGGSLLASFGQYFLKSGGDGHATSWALRYDYPLSKRTGLYAGVAGVHNHGTTAFTVTDAAGPGIAVSPGKDITTGIFGIVHAF
ncbi:porin [Burkholderia multivorans]|uniref:porin n=1 Tax=Burkholderia multivorans TaxID=87883 RepID=UPI001C231FCE|nr:porin [Burkholderia multivorans]MBU9210926.1 porin [Burkholderia multivorans]